MPVWDLWIRLFHWSLAVLVGFQLFSGETGFQFFDWHRLAGEIILALVLFRILWGLVGSSNARLYSLFAHPRRVFSHLKLLVQRKPDSVSGHNAAGGCAVLVMLLLVAVQAITGSLIADEDELVEGAWYGSLSTSTTDLLHKIHHINAEVLLYIVLFHVVMILVYLIVGRQNLIGPMISGRMRKPETTPGKSSKSSKSNKSGNTAAAAETTAPKLGNWWLGLVCALVAFSATGWSTGWSF